MAMECLKYLAQAIATRPHHDSLIMPETRLKLATHLMLRCVATWCSVLQLLQCLELATHLMLRCSAVCCSVVHCGAV